MSSDTGKILTLSQEIANNLNTLLEETYGELSLNEIAMAYGAAITRLTATLASSITDKSIHSHFMSVVNDQANTLFQKVMKTIAERESQLPLEDQRKLQKTRELNEATLHALPSQDFSETIEEKQAEGFFIFGLKGIIN